jgi:hypothetical protein
MPPSGASLKTAPSTGRCRYFQQATLSVELTPPQHSKRSVSSTCQLIQVPTPEQLSCMG